MKRTIAALLVVISFAGAPARAQIVIGGSGGSSGIPVLSSKDFAAALAAIGLDDGQRSVAEASFDEAQDRMFAAVRAFDLARARTEGRQPPTAQEVEQARRAEVQALVAEVETLFQQVSAVIRPEQAEALDRERLGAKRRILRAVLNELDAGASFRSDVEADVAKSDAPPAAKDAAFRQLAGYRQRLAAIMQQTIDKAAEREVRQDREARRNAKRGGDPAGVGGFEGFMAGQQAGRADVTAATRDALKALEAALAANDLEQVRRSALQRVWPRTAMDPLSPRRTFDALLAGRVPAPERAAAEAARPALQAARDAWAARWWTVTMRMTAAEDELGAATTASMLQMSQPPADAAAAEARTAPVRKARQEFDALVAERRTIDRDGWKALAAADPDPTRRELELRCAAAEPRNGGFELPKELPGLDGERPTGFGDGGMIDVAGGEVSGMVVISSGVAIGSPAEPGPDGAPPEEQAAVAADTTVSMQVVDAEPIAIELGGTDNFTFTVGEGEGGFAVADSPAATGLAVRLPKPIDREEAAGIAKALGLDPASPTLQALLDDYAAKARDSCDRLGAPMSDPDHPNGPWLPESRMAQAPALIDAFVGGLAALDDSFIAGIGAAAGAGDAAVRAAQDERSAARARDTRYAAGIMGTARPTQLCGVRLGAVIGAAGLSAEERSTAIAAWAPAATSVRDAGERWRSAMRTGDAEWLSHERRQMALFQEASKNGGRMAVAIDPADAKRIDELVQRQSDALQAMRTAVLDGYASIERALPEDGRRALRSAWFRAAAPKVYDDPKDAMPALDAAFMLSSLSEAQRTQVNALRGLHAARHAEASDRLAERSIAMQTDGDGAFVIGRVGDAQRAVAFARFERQELDARSTRRLRSLLTPEQAAEVPQLRVSPATTPPAPLPTSP